MTKKNLQSDSEIFILNDQYRILSDLMPIPPKTQIVELDLGCGAGDFAVELAARYPERLVFAADVMLPRVRKVVRKAGRSGLDNLKFFRVEARNFLTIVLPDASLDRLHLICPDPWPKKRHRANRLLAADFMQAIWRVLKSDGIFHFATDDAPYLEIGTKNLRESNLFDEADPANALADVADIRTEFEKQWLEQGKSVVHTAWRKRQL